MSDLEIIEIVQKELSEGNGGMVLNMNDIQETYIRLAYFQLMIFQNMIILSMNII